MRGSKWLLSSAAAMALSVLAVWAAAGGATTVGDFALEVARAMGQRPADQAAAVSALRKAGVDLGADLSASLTMGRAATILRGIGLQVAVPREPSAQVSGSIADQIVKAVMLSRGKVSHVSARSSERDCHVSASDPEDCQDGDDDGDHDGDSHDD